MPPRQEMRFEAWRALRAPKACYTLYRTAMPRQTCNRDSEGRDDLMSLPKKPPSNQYEELLADVFYRIPWDRIPPNSELHELQKKFERLRGWDRVPKICEQLDEIFSYYNDLRVFKQPHDVAGQRYFWPDDGRTVLVTPTILWMGYCEHRFSENGDEIFSCPANHWRRFIEELRGTWYKTDSPTNRKKKWFGLF